MKGFFTFSLIILLSVGVWANDTSTQKQNDTKAEKEIEKLQKPLYNPFIERYILDEIRLLREANRNLKIDLHKTLAEKEVEISNNAVGYATSTINNMFYIIAAASTILVLMGWSSIRDMNEKIKGMVDEKVSKVIEEYEKRMSTIEKDLEKRSKQVIQNQKDIEETNIIHSLWMRAAQESTPTGKVELYDEVLSMRPDDVDALTYKAEAILELGEANWSLNLTNQALQIDENYAHSLYQRAKTYSVLGNIDYALSDLKKALELNEEYVQEVTVQKEFQNLLKDKRLKALLAPFEKEDILKG